MEEVIVRMVDLPAGVRAFTLPDEQGDYNVYVNSALSYEQQQKSLLHERRHIVNGDFYSDKTARDIEGAVGGAMLRRE